VSNIESKRLFFNKDGIGVIFRSDENLQTVIGHSQSGLDENGFLGTVRLAQLRAESVLSDAAACAFLAADAASVTDETMLKLADAQICVLHLSDGSHVAGIVSVLDESLWSDSQKIEDAARFVAASQIQTQETTP
jgi:hypothetical protein